MTHTIMTKHRPHLLDFFMPLNGYCGSELHIQLTMTPIEIVTKTKHHDYLSEVVVEGDLGIYRYTVIFPTAEWDHLHVYDALDIQRECLAKIGDNHGVVLRYVGPAVKHRARPSNMLSPTDDLPIFNQYYDSEDYTDWRLGIEAHPQRETLFLPYRITR